MASRKRSVRDLSFSTARNLSVLAHSGIVLHESLCLSYRFNDTIFPRENDLPFLFFQLHVMSNSIPDSKDSVAIISL